jgi:hypothetical protein
MSVVVRDMDNVDSEASTWIDRRGDVRLFDGRGPVGTPDEIRKAATAMINGMYLAAGADRWTVALVKVVEKLYSDRSESWCARQAARLERAERGEAPDGASE